MDPRNPQVDELELAAGLGRIKTMMRLFDTPRDLSMTALSTLANLERLGPHRITELAVLEGVTQPAMTQLISRLEREDLAARLPDPADRRVVVVSITDHGRAELAQRRSAQAKRLAGLLAELSEDDRAAIAAALPALDRLTTRALGSLYPAPPAAVPAGAPAGTAARRGSPSPVSGATE